MGFNIGNRMIDEFLAKTDSPPCKQFKDVGDKLLQAFRMFFGIEAKLNKKSDQQFTISFMDNPFATNVILPEEYKELDYSNMICGMIRGSLEAVNMRVKVFFIKDILKNPENKNDQLSPNYEIQVELEELIKKKLKDYDD